jgi:hypothetical protein
MDDRLYETVRDAAVDAGQPRHVAEAIAEGVAGQHAGTVAEAVEHQLDFHANDNVLPGPYRAPDPRQVRDVMRAITARLRAERIALPSWGGTVKPPIVIDGPGDASIRDLPAEPVLDRDDPEWPMPVDRAGNTTPRRLRVWRTANGIVAVVTEQGGPGPSVTNAAEHAHAALVNDLRAEYPGQLLRVFEHYPPSETSGDTDTFDEITVGDAGPRWSHYPADTMIAMCGPGVVDDAAESERVRAVTARQIADYIDSGPIPIMYAAEAERQLRAAGRCWYQTGYGLPGFEYCGAPASPGEVATATEGMCERHARSAAGIEDLDVMVGDRVRDTDPDADPNWLGTVTHADNNGYRVRWDGQDTDYEADYGDIEPVEGGDVHIVSATAVRTDGGERHHLALCGTDLGPYDIATPRHPVGNSISTGSEQFTRVTCQACKDATQETEERWHPRSDDARPAPTSLPAAGQPVAAAGGETTGLGQALAFTSEMAAAVRSGAAGVEHSLAGLAAGNVTGPAVDHLRGAGDQLATAAGALDAAHHALAGQLTVTGAYADNPGAGTREFLTQA